MSYAIYPKSQNWVIDMNHLTTISPPHRDELPCYIYHELDRDQTAGRLYQHLINLLNYLHHADIFAVNLMFLNKIQIPNFVHISYASNIYSDVKNYSAVLLAEAIKTCVVKFLALQNL